MDSDSPLCNTNDAPSPLYSSPNGTTYSSSSALHRHQLQKSSTSTQFVTSPPPPSNIPSSNSTSLTSRVSAARSNGSNRRDSTTSTEERTTPSSDGSDTTLKFVWGTNISEQNIKSAIETFVRHFREGKEIISNHLFSEEKYMAAIQKVIEIEGEWIDVDACDMFDYDPDLYNKMIRYPFEFLTIFNNVLMDIVVKINGSFEKNVHVRIFNLRISSSMRNLNPSG